MKLLIRISDGVDKVCSVAVIFLLSLMTVTYFAQVLLRYVFQTGLHWTEELTRYSGVWLIMIGGSMMAKRKAFINVSILEELLPGKSRAWLIVFQQLVTAVFFAAMIGISFMMIELAGSQVSTNMDLPMALVYGIFPVAFALLVFQSAVSIAMDIRSIKGGR